MPSLQDDHAAGAKDIAAKTVRRRLTGATSRMMRSAEVLAIRPLVDQAGPDIMAKIEIVSCQMCLAVYERRKERRSARERGAFTCSCGHCLARWNGFSIPIFTKIKESSLPARPDRSGPDR
jgi:hypothetical protein